MKRPLILLAVLLAVTAAYASPAVTTIERSVRATSGLQADFVHRFRPKGFHHDRIERGNVIFGTLPSMRWSYVEPEEKIFVFDGETSWFYTPEEKQVMVHRLTGADRAELPFLMLGDAEAMARDFRLSSRARSGETIVEMEPTSDRVAVRKLTLTLDARSSRIEKLEYVDREGNRTAFEFTNFRKADAGAATFHFDVPAGVDVVEN